MTDGILIGNFPCDDCGSRDNLSIYETEEGTFNGTCWGTCKSEDGKGYKSNNTLSKFEVADELGIKPINERKTREVKKVSTRRTVRRSKKEVKPITPEQIRKIRDNTSSKGNGFRGISDKWLRYYGVQTGYNKETGEVTDRYYPVTKGVDSEGKAKLVGYKQRVVETKQFYPTGMVSKECDFFGQWRCKGSGKYLLIVSGEEDLLAAKMMIEGYRQRSENAAPIDIVSSCIGETSCASQAKLQYDFIDGYDTVIINMDVDDAGDNAVESLLTVLPAGKVKIMSCPAKDANDCLEKGLERDYIKEFYRAKNPTLAGIHGSSTLLEDMYDNVSFEKLPLPEFMNKVNDMFEGGYDFGTFAIIAGDTSVGKSTIVNEIGAHIVDTGDYKPLILSLEAKRSVLARQYLSLKLGKRLGGFKSKEELQAYIAQHQEDVDTFLCKDGEDTFEVIDDRARLTSIDDTFKMIERAIRSLGCRVVIIDVLSDLTDSLTNEQTALFNGRIKALIANHNVLVLGVCHTRKLEGTNKDGSPRIEPTRFDIYGSKTTISSATNIILVWRDLHHKDDIERNTTYVKVDKNRDHSVTGSAGRWLYLMDKHKMVDRDDYEAIHGSF